MKLDTENDRSLLLDIISSAQVPGTHVMTVADLISRIRAAALENPPPSSEDGDRTQSESAASHL